MLKQKALSHANMNTNTRTARGQHLTQHAIRTTQARQTITSELNTKARRMKLTNETTTTKKRTRKKSTTMKINKKRVHIRQRVK